MDIKEVANKNWERVTKELDLDGFTPEILHLAKTCYIIGMHTGYNIAKGEQNESNNLPENQERGDTD